MVAQPAQTTPEVKDLGVIVDLSFDAQITKTVARAFTRANLIHKCFTSRDAATLWRAFVVYVRPLLVYVTCVWSPHRVAQVNRVESVFVCTHVCMSLFQA